MGREVSRTHKHRRWNIALIAIVLFLIPLTLYWLTFLGFVGVNFVRAGVDGVRGWIAHVCLLGIQFDDPVSCKAAIHYIHKCSAEAFLLLLVTCVLIIGMIHTWRRSSWRRKLDQTSGSQTPGLTESTGKRVRRPQAATIAFHVSVALLLLFVVFWTSLLAYLSIAYLQYGTEGMGGAMVRISTLGVPTDQLSWCDKASMLFQVYEKLFLLLLFTAILAMTAVLVQPRVSGHPAQDD